MVQIVAKIVKGVDFIKKNNLPDEKTNAEQAMKVSLTWILKKIKFFLNRLNI